MSAGLFLAPGPAVATRRRRTAADERRLPVAAARICAFALLAAFSSQTWMHMVRPTATAAMWSTLLAALAGACLLVWVARLGRNLAVRTAATAMVAAALLVVALGAAGTPGELARPRGWDDLVGGILQGLSVVPNVRVPYAGSEPWTHLVIVLGGGALVGLAALLAFAPRRGGALGYPIAAAVALGTLYLVPVMQRDTEHQFLGGGAFALLLALFLWLERVRVDAAPLAAGAVGVALVAALVVGPQVDADTALLDYESLAQSLTTPSTRYEWNHDYGPLDWPRDGSEVLRVRSRQRLYWKAANLAIFDGRRWVQPGGSLGSLLDAGLEDANPEWRGRVGVTLRALRSVQFVGAGSTLDIAGAPRTPVEREYGMFSALERPLRRGNAYEAIVYAPRPSAREMRATARSQPPFDTTLTAVSLPGTARTVTIPPWGLGEPEPQAVAAIEASPYARTYALARRLRARSATPYDYVRAIERHLGRGFSYSERPPLSAVPLEEFLFGEQRGYCQQFSGAMALLLRFGGVPARVAAGFSPGAFDVGRREYVVRDIDAHSWVEVFFPGIGWVTRDPTPAASPARSQVADLARTRLDATSDEPADTRGAPAPRTDRGGEFTAGPSAGGGGSSVPVIVLGAVVAAIATAAVLLVVRRRRRRATGHDAADTALAELRRALTRSGRRPATHATLVTLAARWSGTPAEGYVRAVTSARYGYGTAAPTPAQRAGLRRVLGGGGLAARLRAWWAVPPRPSRPWPAARRGP